MTANFNNREMWLWALHTKASPIRVKLGKTAYEPICAREFESREIQYADVAKRRSVWVGIAARQDL